MKEVVGFAYRKDALPEGGNMSGRMQIFAKLRKHDLLPVVSLGAEAAFTDDGVEVQQLTDEQSTAYLGHVALNHMGLIVNRLDRSVKKDRLPQPVLLPPMINENATRSLAWRKHRANDEVLGPIGINLPTVLARDTANVADFMRQHPARHYIVKPDNGTNGNNVQRLAAADVTESFASNPQWFGNQVVQPRYDFSLPFPGRLKPYDQASCEALEGWNRAGITKELRVYGFHSPLQTEVFPVARAIAGGKDNWLFVDPESVPPSLLERTATAIRLAATITKAPALLGTVDYGYGVLDDGPPEWRAIELNAKAPYLIGYDKHPDVADRLRTMLSDQIAATIHATSVGVVH